MMNVVTINVLGA